MSGSLPIRAAQVLLLLALLGLASRTLRAQPPAPRYAVRLEQGSADTPAPLSAASLPVTIALDQLEREIVGAEAGSQSARSVTQLEAEAQRVLARATTTVDRLRARRIIRRLNRIVDESSSPIPQRAFDVLQASYEDEISPPLLGSRLVESGEVCEPKLSRLAQAASRLAQYGAPPTETPACEPGMMPVPMNTVVACPPPPTRHYANIDAIGWWVKGDRLPALVTTSPIGTPQDDAGVLGDPSTSVLFGEGRINNTVRWGGRVQGGVWLDDFQTIAVEGFYFGLPTATTTFSKSSTFSDGSQGDPILARPFFNSDPSVNADASTIVAFPDYNLGPDVLDLDGSIKIQETSSVQSGGGGLRYALGAYDSDTRIYLLAAYRYFNLSEQLNIRSRTSSSTLPPPFDDGQIQVIDKFGTRNIFNGGEIGASTEIHRGRWSIVAEKRLALGNMNERLIVDGSTSAIYDTYTATYEGGLLAQPTNIGTRTKNRFAYIPQLDLKVGYQVLPAMRLTVGYTLIYVSRVIRPGNQIDPVVNGSQIAGQPLVGPADPVASTKDIDLWLQGISMGLDLRF